MRDLALVSLSSKRNRFAKNILSLIVVVIVLGFGLVIVKNRFNNTVGGGSQIILQEAPRGLVSVAVDDSTIRSDGVDLTIQSATFSDVKYGGEAKASATRSFGGGTYILSVNAALPDPRNTYYQVWLVGGGNVVPIDYMSGSKNSWSLRLRSSDKYLRYDGIWITLERSKDDIVEEHVLEGSF